MGRTIPRTLVLLVEDEPVGTASLAAHDLDERPDLTPWLTGVFVAPHARGQGYAAELIAAVEQEAVRHQFQLCGFIRTRQNVFTPELDGERSRPFGMTVSLLRSCGVIFRLEHRAAPAAQDTDAGRSPRARAT
jgi:GNAT superfamily N-acetyltransferase